MNFSQSLSSMRSAPGSIDIAFGDDWSQGRSLFGGAQGAIVLLAMRTLVAPTLPLRTLQMTFIAPVPAGSVQATARVLRTGKSATHVEARIESNDDLLAHAIGVFGSPRESIVRRDLPAPRHSERAPIRLGFHPGITPNFMQHFDVQLVDGALPFSNSPVERTAFDLGLRDDGAATDVRLLLIADFVPPVALSWMPKVSPGSSLTWMLEMTGARFEDQPLAGWHVEAEMVGARDGYTSQSTTIWAPNGAAIALSRQSMVVFA